MAESGPARRIKQEIDAEIGVVEQHEELLQLPDRRRTHFERHHFADEHVQPHHVTATVSKSTPVSFQFMQSSSKQ